MKQNTTGFKIAPRNFVAKNAKTAGAGRHRSTRDYERQPKHRNRDFGQTGAYQA
jgi:hypothetical protein